jgi:NADPH-dependent curcumin reductase CurA
VQNRVFRLAKRPVGNVTRDDFTFTEEPIAELGAGDVLVEVQYLSLDPAMRGWMNEGKSYVPPVELGAPMRALGAGRVVASKDPAFAEGDTVTGITNVQSHAVMGGKGWTKIPAGIAPLPTWLGALGMPGYTAYFGLLDVGKAKAGDTVVVSAAAGAVGGVAGQIAKAHGCHVVGIAGGPAKCAHVTGELRFDACIDYKAADVKKTLAELCPKGIDVYFDNVGGDILDAALARLARGARVVICGAISQYNAVGGMKGPSNYMSLLVNRASMTGFVVFDFAARYGEAVQAIGALIQAGKLKPYEEIARGLETFPDALQRLFKGENTGKLVLAV